MLVNQSVLAFAVGVPHLGLVGRLGAVQAIFVDHVFSVDQILVGLDLELVLGDGHVAISVSLTSCRCLDVAFAQLRTLGLKQQA